MKPRALLIPAILACACALAGGARNFREDFSARPTRGCVPDGGRIGPWTVESTGFGCVKTAGEAGEAWLHASAGRSASPRETHAFLITGPSLKAPFTLSARLQTVERNRAGSEPNDWETAWLVWDYADRKHFYYFVARPDGWELGKRDPAFRGGQRFLTDGKEPVFPLRTWARIKIAQNAEHRIFVYADGKLVTAFTDVQRPYEGGKIGLYGEDCFARFDDVEARSGEDELVAGDGEHDRQ